MIMNLWQGSSKRAGQLSFVDTGRGQAGGETWSDGNEKACKPGSLFVRNYEQPVIRLINGGEV